MKKIKMSKGLVAILDKEDYETFGKMGLHVSQSRNRFYVRALILKKRFYLHRLISKPPAGYQVDHINGNTLDNRRANLRVCTNAENNQSKGKHSDNTSGFKGVYFFKWGNRSKRWFARISTKGKAVGIGYYETPKLAAKAYDKAALKYHGKFALLNFPPKKAV